MNAEVSEDTEWTLFNDKYVSTVRGNWKDIVRDCVASRYQPTVLLYEQFSEEDTDFVGSPDKSLFKFSRPEVKELIEIASQVDDSLGDVNEDEIEMQKEYLRELER